MKKNELKFTISSRWVQSTPEFICAVEHNLDLGPDIEWVDLVVQAPVINDNKTGFAKEVYGGGLLPSFVFRLSEPSPDPFKHSEKHRGIIQGAINKYKLTPSELKQLQAYCLPGPEINPKANDYFGELLKRVLQGAGYKVVIVQLRPKYFYAPTIDHVAQRIYTADKRGTFLSDLMAIGKRAGIDTGDLLFDQQGFNVIGFKVNVDIPSKRAAGEAVQLELNFDFREEDGFKIIPIKEMEKQETKNKLNTMLQDIEQKISKDLDSLTLRVKDAVLLLSQDKGSRKFDFTENELLDLLYDRKRKGNREYHDTRYKKRVRDRLQLISRIKLTYAVQMGDKTFGIKDIPYIILNPEGKPFIEQTDTNGKVKRRYNFQSIEVPERYYNLFGKNFAGQFNREAPKLQGVKYSIYKYLTTWWRIEWMKQKGVYQWWLSDILLGAGVKPPTKAHTARFIKNLTADLDDLKKSKLIGPYRRLNKNKDPIADRWRFEAPKELKERFEHIGKDHAEAQKIRRLKAENKRLKLEKNIADLKKGKT